MVLCGSGCTSAAESSYIEKLLVILIVMQFFVQS